MRFPFNPKIFPRLSLWLGIAGFSLRVWLFSTGVDHKGLLATGHPANGLTFILSGVFLLLLALGAQTLHPVTKYGHLFPASPRRALGDVLGVVGILYAAIFMHRPFDLLAVIILLLGLLAAAALVGTALCRTKGLRPNFLQTCAITAFMLLHTVALCRQWGTVSQVERYFFPLLASVFLLLTCYQHSLLSLQQGSRRQYVFYNQAALFFCMLSATEHMVFYLCIAGWMTLDRCSFRTRPRGRFLKGRNEQ